MSSSDPFDSIPKNKMGNPIIRRNGKCPCGSGKKVKKCHPYYLKTLTLSNYSPETRLMQMIAQAVASTTRYSLTKEVVINTTEVVVRSEELCNNQFTPFVTTSTESGMVTYYTAAPQPTDDLNKIEPFIGDVNGGE